LAPEYQAKAVVTGDSLGQVASQTLENLHAIQSVTGMLMLRPLIAADKKFIINKAREIGTYDISVLPHDDACALFTPKKPETRAKLDEVEKEWNRLQVDGMIKDAMDRAEYLVISRK
jgi:thiamine biosynthesis protein ThiI